MTTEIEVPVSKLLKKTQFLKKNSLLSKAEAENVQPSLTTGKRIGVSTLGCKVNTYESELISEAFQGEGWQTVSSREVADMYIINTCTVTNEADKQARREVRKVIKQNSEALVVVTGCYAQIEPDACAAIPGVDFVVGNDRKLDIHSLLPQLKSGELPSVFVGDLDEHVSLPEEVLTSYEGRTRAFIQIQQGCDQGCTFCIIHVARGPSRSLPLTMVRRQAERLAINGYKELVICGVDLGSYGEDFSDHSNSLNLVSLLNELLTIKVDGNEDFRIRLSSIDPVHITDELIDLFNTESRLCNHIHLSLQSGSTLILKRMKRRYDKDFLYNRINAFRNRIPELVISADVMVGFPTESDENFMDTRQALIDLEVAFPHVFSYSIREGTPASRIPTHKQIDSAVKKERSKNLRDLAVDLQKSLYQRRLGTIAWALPETIKETVLKARSEDYLSINVLRSEGGDVELGKWLKVQYTSIEDGKLTAVIV